MSTAEQTRPIGTPAIGRLHDLFDLQRAAFDRTSSDYDQRIAALKTLETALLEHQDEIVRCTHEDFGGRARQETLLLELAPLVDGIRHARKHLAKWMRPVSVAAGIHFFPGKARIVYQPLGVVGILGAWNYPTLLTLRPLVDAIAAGNHAMLKPSELAPRTAALLKTIIAASFPEDYVAVVTGDAQLAAEFCKLPFDHILFTGSTRVGKLVMKAAAENLTPVTLELGGKCPAIIHRDFPMRTAVERIITGKLYNAGQTCLAPDYVLVHESQRDRFVKLAAESAEQRYPNWSSNRDYTRIISQQHFERLKGLLHDAIGRGAQALCLCSAEAPASAIDRLFLPQLLLDVSDEMQVMQEEIFGPILPVLTYLKLDDALRYVNAHAHPLALYYFDNDLQRVNRVLAATRSGGVTVNDVIFHIAQNNLPFGGVGPSGMGCYHGRAGFATFSKQKGVFLQSRYSSLKFLRPPYGPLTERFIRFLLGRS